MRVLWLIVGPVIGWLIGSVMAGTIFVTVSARSVESRIFEAALPFWFAAFGLAVVMLVRLFRNDP